MIVMENVSKEYKSLKLAENYMKQECADDQKNISSRKR